MKENPNPHQPYIANDLVYIVVRSGDTWKSISKEFEISQKKLRKYNDLYKGYILQPGDILTAEQISQMTFSPVGTETDREVAVGYLPIYKNHVAEESALTLSILGKEDKAPVAEDFALETYKNLATTGKLKVVPAIRMSLN